MSHQFWRGMFYGALICLMIWLGLIWLFAG